jgi:regulator of replication initiation timing
MPNYECSRCHKVFKQKCHYDNHMKRKFPCKEKKITVPIIDENSLGCPFCEREFTTKYNLLRHINYVCRSKNQMVKIVEENNQLKTEIKNLQMQVTNNINSNNNNINSNNVIQNINIVAYGKENIERITDKDFRTIMRRGMLSVPELVKRIHFDEKVPENHNVYISNLRNQYVLMYDGNKWRLIDRKEALQQIYGDHYEILETKFGELIGEDSLDESTIEKFRNFLNYVNLNEGNNDEEDNESNKYVDMVKEDLKKLLYENRDIVEKTKKNLKK